MNVADARAHPDIPGEQVRIDLAYDALEGMIRSYGSLPEGAAHVKVAHTFKDLSDAVLARLQDSDNLCLGRIDPEQGDPIYIGRFAVHDDRNNLVLANWQAPAVKPFLSATPENAMGLRAKRAFDCERQRLIAIYEDMFGQEGAVQPARGVDDLLLSELERARDDHMRDIVRTIRADQFALMSIPLDEFLIVQGSPGSGKTQVGLHRASYLLANNPELATTGVLVVGPNRIFMRYIAAVLPSLGDTAVDQSAIQYLVEGVRARAQEPPDVARVKGSSDMATVITREIWQRVAAPAGRVSVTLEARPYTVDASTVPALIRHAEEASSTYMDARRRFTDDLRDAFYDAANTNRSSLSRGDFAYALNQRSEFRLVLERIWPGVSATQAIRELLGSRDRLRRSGSGILAHDQIDLLYRQNPDREGDVQWTEHDLPLIDEAASILNGSSDIYGHVVIDEAQDLTPMQLRMVGRRTRSHSITMLGDLAQAAGMYAYSSWEEIASHLGRGKPRVEELRHAYRVPRQIMEFSLATLHEVAPLLAEPVCFREGEKPEVKPVGRQFLGEEIGFEAILKGEAGGSVAVIAPESLTPMLRAEFDRNGITYRDAAAGELSGGVELLTPRMVKGLEFDHVILVEPLAMVRESVAASPLKELYVSLTRSTKTLTIIHSEPLPATLGGSGDLSHQAAETASVEAPLPPAPGVPSSRLSDALSYARLVGGGDAETVRAVERSIAVAGLLLEAHADEDEIVAARLRPVVKGERDQAVADVRRLFGPGVATALERTYDRPDESPIVIADQLRAALMSALAENDAEIVIGRLQALAEADA